MVTFLKKLSIKFPSFKSSLPTKTPKTITTTRDRIKAPKPEAAFKEDVSFGLRLNFFENNKNKNLNADNKKNEINIIEKITIDNINISFDQLGREQMKFNKNLRKEPQNIELWIEFINFQEKIFEKRGKLNERKISIVKKAIELNSRNVSLIKLHLRLAEETEDTASLMKLWENYLRKFESFKKEMKLNLSSKCEAEDSCEDDHWKLQEEYLNFRQNRFLAFNFDEVNEAFSTAFKNFKESKKYSMTLFKIYISFLKRCGFRERIVGLCQACIEINIEYFNYGVIDDIDGYEDQWDAGVMEHIGDVIFRNYKMPSIFPDKILNFDDLNSSSLRKWIKLEKYRELQFWHPIQNSDIDDLEGQVFFDDIKDFLILFKEKNIKNHEMDKNLNLIFIKRILEALADAFDFNVNFEDPKQIANGTEFSSYFLTWYFEVIKTMSIHFKNDWKFTCSFLLFMNYFYEQTNCQEETDIYAKNYLSRNRESFEIFLAYGRYQQIIGNHEMANKVFSNLSNRPLPLNLQNELKLFIEQVQIDQKNKKIPDISQKNKKISEKYKNIPNISQKYKNINDISLKYSELNDKSEVYELIRNNPGNKELYLKIIDEIEAKDESLAMEVFNLLDEQQLRLHTLLEEVLI